MGLTLGPSTKGGAVTVSLLQRVAVGPGLCTGPVLVISAGEQLGTLLLWPLPGPVIQVASGSGLQECEITGNRSGPSLGGSRS